MPRDIDRRLLKFARGMRREATEAERKLWLLLRDRRCDGYKFRRQHPVEGYVTDFYCAEALLVVELDGNQHGEPEQERYDQERTEKLTELGITVMRFADGAVLKDPVVVRRTILRHLTQVCPHPDPLPSTGEGEER